MSDVVGLVLSFPANFYFKSWHKTVFCFIPGLVDLQFSNGVYQQGNYEGLGILGMIFLTFSNLNLIFTSLIFSFNTKYEKKNLFNLTFNFEKVTFS